MRVHLIALFVFVSGSAFAFSADCPSDDGDFAFRNGELIEVGTGEKILNSSAQVVNVISQTVEPCVVVGKSIVDVEITTRLIQVNHSYMGVPRETQFVCPMVEFKESKCGE
ncbi:hypothetical protein GW916_12425 [bacterium]|nr:hypothetical protein [bacterium]